MSETHVIPVYSYQRRTARYFIERLPDKITLEMVEIPAGSFVMGAPEEEAESLDSERPQHEVNVPTLWII